MRVWACSDIHTDYEHNLEWVRALAAEASGRSGGGGGDGATPPATLHNDALILAGDVTDSLDRLTQTLELLAATFAHVFFIPGNHDLWVRREDRGQYDSLEKLRRVLAVCQQLGVHTAPACVSGVWIVPLYSWYHASWDREPDVPGSTPIEKAMLDFHVCSWGSLPHLSTADDSLACHFDALNEPAFSEALQRIDEQTEAAGGVRPPVLSFSHFLPRQDLLPEKRMLYYPNLAKAAGSDWLEARIRRLRPLAHVFGHTHFSWDAEIEGIRYIQWPLGYPQEQRRRRNGGAGWMPLLLYDTAAAEAAAEAGPAGAAGAGGREAAAAGLAPPRSCYWSDYYSAHRRDPFNVCPAPWVAG